MVQRLLSIEWSWPSYPKSLDHIYTRTYFWAFYSFIFGLLAFLYPSTTLFQLYLLIILLQVAQDSRVKCQWTHEDFGIWGRKMSQVFDLLVAGLGLCTLHLGLRYPSLRTRGHILTGFYHAQLAQSVEHDTLNRLLFFIEKELLLGGKKEKVYGWLSKYICKN